MSANNQPVEAALFSAFTKCGPNGEDGIELLAKPLADRGWPILASGGTAKYLAGKGIAVRDIAELVGEPILEHRVVTLSREIHAGLLALEKDREELLKLGVPWIGLVQVNLYPLEKTLMNHLVSFDEALEKVDIGGPTMLRSGAKGQRVVVSSRAQFQPALDYLDGKETRSLTQNRRLICGFAADAEAVARAHGKLAEGFYRSVASGNII
jgi:phosphoribosylaminoimidazolecarboxamide formyltransferase / IMP cyclohydrolase